MANKLLEATYNLSEQTTAKVQKTTKWYQWKEKITEVLVQHPKGITRRKLYQTMQRYLNTEELQICLHDLSSFGAITFMDEELRILESATKSPKMLIIPKFTSKEELFPSGAEKIRQDIAEEEHAEAWEEGMNRDNYDEIEANIDAIINRQREEDALVEVDKFGYTITRRSPDARTRKTGDNRRTSTTDYEGDESESVFDDS